TVVTPYAKYNGASPKSGRAGAQGISVVMCTCASVRPGTRYRPNPSMTLAPGGTGTSVAAPMAAIRTPRTITVCPDSTRSLSIGIALTLTNAIAACVGGDVTGRCWAP